MPTAPSDQDQLDSSPLEAEAVYFDSHLNAWVLSKYEDVLTAFRASGLAPSGAQGQRADSSGEDVRMRIREEATEGLSPERLRVWRENVNHQANKLAEKLPREEVVDLMEAYARPLCLSLAAMATGITCEQAVHLQELGLRVSASAAEPREPGLRADAKAAEAELAPYFPPGPESLRSSGYVALSQTLPYLLGNAWLSLLRNPGQWEVLHQHPALTAQAIDELLRHAGLPRTITRIAIVDIDLNGCFIREGERVILRIVAANHDPDRFSRPHEIDITRNDKAHFTLGSGSHACVAAGLIRMAAATITRPLLQRFGPPALARPVEWQGGSGFLFARSLWVRFPRESDSPWPWL